MSVTVRIPTPLRSLTGGADLVELEGQTVGAILDALDAKHAGIKDRICKQGQVQRFVNVYVNQEDIRFAENLQTPVSDGDEVSIVPAIAGG